MQSLRFPLVVAALCFLAAPVLAQGVSPCTPTSATHQRWGMKTRPAPAAGLDDAQPVTIRQIARWAVPRGKNLKDEPIVDREWRIVTVRGFVRLVKISPDDCDVHVQLTPGATRHHPQVIAEIPPDATALRLRLSALLGTNITKSTKYFDGDRAKAITFTGYAFLDTSHWCRRDLKGGCGHGRGVATLWEIHPVLDVQ